MARAGRFIVDIRNVGCSDFLGLLEVYGGHHFSRWPFLKKPSGVCYMIGTTDC